MKPTPLVITMAALGDRDYGRDGWVYADEVRHRLMRLGFEVSPQQVVASLRAMSRVDAPWVEVRDNPHFPIKEYRVTRFGQCDMQNRWPWMRPVMPWLPTYRGGS